MSAQAALYPVEAVEVKTSGAAYITDPTFVCCEKSRTAG